MRTPATFTVHVRREPDAAGRFTCFVNGWLEQWTLEQIKAHVAAGGGLEEW